MGSARSEILDRIRASLASDRAKTEGIELPPVLRSPGSGGDGALFVERLMALGAHVYRPEPGEDLGSVLSGVLEGLGAKLVAVSDGEGLGDAIPHFEGGREVLTGDVPREQLFRCDAGISGVQAAIAETGTLVLATDSERHRLTSLVPEVHVAVVRTSDVVPSLDEAMTRFGARPGGPPRCVTFITGPSRTADIELQLVVGVHGPRELHVVFMSED